LTLRTGHGSGAGVPRIEVLPVDELPAGVPALSAPVQPGRDQSGRYLAGTPETRAAASAAAKAKRNRTALAHTLGVTSDDPTWAAYLRSAEAFRRAQVRLLAATVGGGQCGPAPAALVASAALALAASRFKYARGEMLEGARLAADVRQNLLAAHELCAREAIARPPTAADFPWLTPSPKPKPEPIPAKPEKEADQ
jgi:hypothetical protein